MNFLNNITLRKKVNRCDPNTSNVSQESTDTFESKTKSTEDEHSSSSLTIDGANNDSMPELSYDDNKVPELQLQIQELNLKLIAANEEINILRIENADLKTKVKKECIETPNLNTSISNPTITTLQQNLVELENQLKQARNEIDTLNNQIATLQELLQYKQNYDFDFLTSKHNINTRTIHNERNSLVPKNKLTGKIHILSNNQRNKILSIAENTFPNNYEVCHYLLPNCNTVQMIQNIESKLCGFTMSDFCIIMIGEEDFRTTRDYHSLISKLKETLEKVKYTNVIICAPTYKYGVGSMYNWRIENFNNKLYLDILANEYAYFLDSNKNLKCSYEMFHKNKGTINNYAMSIICKDILDYIQGIKEELSASTCEHNFTSEVSQDGEDTSTTPTTFFRE
ncbi:hypothetical protein B5X24_HaOG202590 [Helicoverpa armigera]|uniref:Uncharacterized protein n=1 Tax=Helicoverpa armigera TaxID=29058 RepID=A0A2W1BSV9_HELAM|nr:hypothetical protein B5X24_HaOG202590 [Helicoverpa armigera]